MQQVMRRSRVSNKAGKTNKQKEQAVPVLWRYSTDYVYAFGNVTRLFVIQIASNDQPARHTTNNK